MQGMYQIRHGDMFDRHMEGECSVGTLEEFKELVWDQKAESFFEGSESVNAETTFEDAEITNLVTGEQWAQRFPIPPTEHTMCPDHQDHRFIQIGNKGEETTGPLYMTLIGAEICTRCGTKRHKVFAGGAVQDNMVCYIPPMALDQDA